MPRCGSLDGADDEGVAGGLDDFLGDGAELVDVHDPLGLRDEAAGQAEVAAGDPVDGGDGLGRGAVAGPVEAQVGPLAGEDEGLLAGGQGPVVVDEPDAAVELGVAGEALFDAGHADEDQAEAAAVVVVAELLERGDFQPVGLVDDEQLGERGAAVRVAALARVFQAVAADRGEALAELPQLLCRWSSGWR